MEVYFGYPNDFSSSGAVRCRGRIRVGGILDGLGATDRVRASVGPDMRGSLSPMFFVGLVGGPLALLFSKR